jgi:hypothetical protein
MKRLRLAAPGTTVELSAETYNELAAAVDEWRNLRVLLRESNTGITRLARAPGGSVLDIVIPPAAAAGIDLSTYSELAITFCDDTDTEITKVFLVRDP